jgi:hypothetical protein
MFYIHRKLIRIPLAISYWPLTIGFGFGSMVNGQWSKKQFRCDSVGEEHSFIS